MAKQLKLPTLLVVSDNPSVRFWVKKHLDDQFFIIHAESQQETMDALNASLDFIIVDETLEDCDALELCQILSNKTQKNMVPILLVTGKLKKAFRDKAIECGVNEFLSNQLDVEELFNRIESGKKAAASRQKIENLGQKIAMPKLPSFSLKHKLVMNEPGVRMLAKAKAEKIPVALLFMRMDNESENKELHQLLGNFVKNLLRTNDLLLPSEGGFVILLWNINLGQARIVATKIHNAVVKQKFSAKEKAVQINVSIAVSMPDTTESNFNNMLNSAAKALQAQNKTNSIISIEEEL